MKTTHLAVLGALGLVALSAYVGYNAGQRGAGSASAPPTIPTSAPTVATSTPKPTSAPRKLLYYRNPMGLPDTSPTPKKDSMGMDYLPVYEGEDDAGAGTTDAAHQISLSTEKIQKLGVRTEAAALRSLDSVVRAAARIEPNERHLYTIAPKFEGYIEKLLVNASGQPVSKGQPLFEVYSPDLVSAQREYAIATQGQQALKEAPAQAQGSMQQLADSALARLKNWDIPEDQIQRLRSTGQTQRTITFRSPVSGVVTEKKAQQGMRFMPGDVLYQVTDLSSVWVMADVFEQDLAQVRIGAQATVTINAFPGKTFHGRVDYLYPNLKAETRTVPTRIELANPGGILKPGMFAQIELKAAAGNKVLTVPESAVLDSGTRSVVLVQIQPGHFEPRTVSTGQRGSGWVQILQGVREGEQVVVAANFLIDAESNLKAALQGMNATEAAAGAASKPAPAVAATVQPAASAAPAYAHTH